MNKRGRDKERPHTACTCMLLAGGTERTLESGPIFSRYVKFLCFGKTRKGSHKPYFIGHQHVASHRGT